MSQPNDELDPRLKEMIETLRPVPPRDPRAAARGRAQFLSQATEIGQAVSKSKNQRHIGWFGSILMVFQKKEHKPMFTTLVSLFTVFVLAFGGSVATAYAAQDDLPGDTLYSVKSFTEDARLAVSNDAQDVALYEEFAQRRVQEALLLSDSSRFSDVETAMQRYEAQLQAMNQTLARLMEKDPTQANALAARIQTMLSEQIQTLALLREQVSDPARVSIDDALSQSRQHAGIELVGLVETISSDLWNIAGRDVAVTAQTEIKSGVVVGSLVKAHAYLAPDGTLTAREIELISADTTVDFTGTVDEISDAAWTVGGQPVAVNDATDLRGDIQVGDWVVVKALVGADGALTALSIHLPDDEDAAGNGNEVNDNGNQNGNANGNENGNDNGNHNGNDDRGNGNVNQNGNDDSGNDNGNSNQNGNEDHRGNGNTNQNGNDDHRGNGNTNQNGNDDDRGNDNGNMNQNGNDDDRGNGNMNQNGNDDDHGNGNINQNGNDDRGNDNSNENGNDNSNQNDNDNSGGTGNDNGSVNENSNDSGSGGSDNGNDSGSGGSNSNDSGGGSNDNGSGSDNGNDSGSGNDNGNDSGGKDDNGSLNLSFNLMM
jgi:hypothetical protein